MKATEDFYDLARDAYIIVAAKQVMSSTHTRFLNDTAKTIVNEFVKIEQVQSTCDDQIYLYSCDVITLGLIWKSYHDASREGDGERVLLIWKFLMIIFRLSNRRNYTKEAILLLLQYHYLLPEQKAAQLAYSRFVNTQGRVGQNISSDLHMEHLNR